MLAGTGSTSLEVSKDNAVLAGVVAHKSEEKSELSRGEFGEVRLFTGSTADHIGKTSSKPTAGLIALSDLVSATAGVIERGVSGAEKASKFGTMTSLGDAI